MYRRNIAPPGEAGIGAQQFQAQRRHCRTSNAAISLALSVMSSVESPHAALYRSAKKLWCFAELIRIANQDQKQPDGLVDNWIGSGADTGVTVSPGCD
jgi:hypothetical protein